MSPSRSFTCTHEKRKIKKLGIHVSHKHLSLSHAVHLTMFISYCTICLDQHHIQPSQPTTPPPLQLQVANSSSSCWLSARGLNSSSGWVVRFAPCDMYANTWIPVHICPELSWHPRGKRKTTKLYNKWVMKINDQLLNSKMLTNSAFVHLDVF